MILNLISIVEGHGEVAALPILLRRLWQELVPVLDLRVAPPIRISRKKLVKANELEKAVDFAAARLRTSSFLPLNRLFVNQVLRMFDKGE